MEKLFFVSAGRRYLGLAALALSLLAKPASTLAQTGPTIIYGLGTATQNFSGIAAGQQLLLPLYPANLSNASSLFGTGQIIVGITAGQQLVGIDIRPTTSQLYGLGYNSVTGAAQLYLLSMPTTSTTTVTATPLNATPTTLNLQDPNSSQTGTTANTRGLLPNVGFDFDPRADRIRVVAPNGTNYRLDPNTGALASTDTNLSYAAGANVGHAPYIGTAAYTNSAQGVTGTTLYDVDVTNSNGLLSTQSPPDGGTLTPVAPVMFRLAGSSTSAPLASPTIGLDLDIFYDRTSSSNLAYLVEARYSDPANSDINNGTSGNQFSSNLWAFDLSTGLAVGRNIFGRIPVFIANIATVSATQLVWTGTVGPDWQTAANWYPNQVPTAADNVFIAGNGTQVASGVFVANQPTVTATTSVAQNVTLDNGAVLTNANGSQLSVAGSFINNGGSVTGAGTGTLALVGAAQQEIGGSAATTFFNLQVGQNGATTTSTVAVRRSVTVSGVLTIGTGQPFTLLSSAAGTAYVVNNSGGAITGLATVQRYITPSNPGSGYRHYSSPVSRVSTSTTSNTVADFATGGFTPVVNPAYNSATNPRQTQPYPTVFYYDQSRLATSNAAYAVGDFDNGFLSPAALTDQLAATRGYVVNIPSTVLVDFQGQLNNGNYSTGTLRRGAQSSAGYHLLGNPYPGAISYTTLYSASSGIQDGLYVYRSNGPYTGGYSTYLANGQAVNGGTDNIPVGQGFFVRAQVGGGTVNFTNSARTNAPETALFSRTASTAPTLALTLSGNSAANQTRIYFDPNATSGYDDTRDAAYLPPSHGLDLASEAAPEALAINALPDLTATTTVPLRLHAPAAGTYTLTVDELANLPAGYHAYLRDGRTNTYRDLATTPSLAVVLAPADAATGRFAVVFGTTQPLATAPAALAGLVALYPNPAHGTTTLLLPQALRGAAASQVEVLNSLGQVVLRHAVASGTPDAVELQLGGLAAGIYTVRVQVQAYVVSKRLTLN